MDRFLKFLIALAVAASAVIILPGTIYPYVVPKAVFFFIVVEIMAILYFMKKSEIRTDMFSSGPGLFLLIFFIIQVISALQGENFVQSLFGTPLRMMGLLANFHFLLFFFITSQVLKEKKDFFRVFDLSLLFSLPVIAIALFQYLYPGLFLNLRNDPTMYSLLGNKAYMGYYCLMHFFLALMLGKERGKHWWYGTLAALHVLTIVLLGIRGVYIGFLVGVVTWALLQIGSFMNKRGLMIAVTCTIIMALLIGSGFAVKNTYPESKLGKTIARLSDFSLSSRSVQSRFMVWGIAWKSFTERPILGWGPENFELAYNRYYEAKLLRFGAADTFFDRAHNVFLDVMVGTGMIGALVFLLFFASIFWHSRKNPLLFCLFLSFFITSLFEVESFTSLVLFFFLLSFIAVGRGDGESWFPDPRKKALFQGFLTVLFFYTLISATGFYLTNRAILRDLMRFDTKAFQSTFDRGYRLLSLSPTFQIEQVKNAASYFTQIVTDNSIRNLESEVITFLHEKIEKSFSFIADKDIRFFYLYGKFYKLISRGDLSQYPVAKKLLQKGLLVNLQRQIFHISLGDLFLQQGQVPEGMAYLWQAIKLDDQAAFSHWFLAKAYYSQGKVKEAVEKFEYALQLGFVIHNVHEAFLVAEILVKEKRFETVNRILKQALNFEPYNAKIHAKVATSYVLLNEKEKAREHAERAIELDPSFQKGSEMFFQSP